MRTARIAACLALLSGIVTQLPQQSAAGATAPLPTTSRYMKTTDVSVAYNLGCAAGKASQQGVVILDFGQPALSGTTYGSYIFASNGFRSTKQVEEAAKNFLAGYWNCSPLGPEITLAVGTTNYHGATNYNHGKAWAQMVNNIGLWLTQRGYAAQEDAAAGSDFELDWNSVANTRSWVSGYASTYTKQLFNYGDAAGCPPYGSCDNGWTQEDVWYVSWGAAPAYAIPEIYTTSGSMAAEWYRLALYGYTNHGGAIQISGTLTQSQACVDVGNTCNGTNNSPSAGWNQLTTKLNSDTRTAQWIPNSSDITWQN